MERRQNEHHHVPKLVHRNNKFFAGVRIPHVPQEQTPRVGMTCPPWERVTTSMLKAVFVEFVCVSIFIFVATGTVVFGCHSDDTTSTPASASGQVVAPQDCFLSNSRVLTIATSFGWSIAVLVYVSASFSGGHLNPAVTLAFVITKKLSLLRAALYWVAQLAGAVLGSAFVFAVDRTGWYAAKGATNRLLTGISPASGWLLEMLLTFLLVFVVLAATDASRAKISTHLPILAPFAIGLAVFISHLAAVAIDGCSINPARSFGPAVVSGIWADQWIFWAGPMSGAVLAALMYEVLLRPSGVLLATNPPAEGNEDTTDELMEKGHVGDGATNGDGGDSGGDTVAHRLPGQGRQGMQQPQTLQSPNLELPIFSGAKGARVVDTSAMKRVMVPKGEHPA